MCVNKNHNLINIFETINDIAVILRVCIRSVLSELSHDIEICDFLTLTLKFDQLTKTVYLSWSAE